MPSKASGSAREFRPLTFVALLLIFARLLSAAPAQIAGASSASKGLKLEKVTLVNGSGLRVEVISLGASIQSIFVPGKNKKIEDVVLGFENLTDYQSTSNKSFGCVVGRYANRIRKAKYSIGKEVFQLDANLDTHHIHGGQQGFCQKNWKLDSSDANHVKFSYVSPDGEGGYGGELSVSVSYHLTEQNEVIMEYLAKVIKKPTVLNLTTHLYLNLSGNLDSSILKHQLRLESTSVLATDSSLMPTGKILKTQGTDLDFNLMHPIGEKIGKLLTDPARHGYDHSYILKPPALSFKLANHRDVPLDAEVYEPLSGRTLAVYTTEPSVQLYTGNWLDVKGKKGLLYSPQSGFCLEAQHYPDSPHHPEFPSTVLSPGRTYTQTTVYKFGIR